MEMYMSAGVSDCGCKMCRSAVHTEAVFKMTVKCTPQCVWSRENMTTLGLPIGHSHVCTTVVSLFLLFEWTRLFSAHTTFLAAGVCVSIYCFTAEFMC